MEAKSVAEKRRARILKSREKRMRAIMGDKSEYTESVPIVAADTNGALSDTTGQDAAQSSESSPSQTSFLSLSRGRRSILAILAAVLAAFLTASNFFGLSETDHMFGYVFVPFELLLVSYSVLTAESMFRQKTNPVIHIINLTVSIISIQKDTVLLSQSAIRRLSQFLMLTVDALTDFVIYSVVFFATSKVLIFVYKSGLVGYTSIRNTT